jgi:hypothetical protein
MLTMDLNSTNPIKNAYRALTFLFCLFFYPLDQHPENVLFLPRMKIHLYATSHTEHPQTTTHTYEEVRGNKKILLIKNNLLFY